jgi:hypothetical protein
MLLKGTPEWYGDLPSAADRKRLAHDAESKLIKAQNWAATLRADEQRAARRAEASAGSTTAPAPRAGQTHLVEVTQEELNALFDTWSDLYAWRATYSAYIEDPQIILRDKELILAGRVKEIGSIASFRFHPHLDAEGDLRMDLVSVAAGRLPLPEAVWTKWRDRLVLSMRQRIPQWQGSARIDPSGAANFSAVAASLSRMLARVAEGQAAEPILFFPLADGGSSVPVRVTELTVHDRALRLVVQPLTAAERAALLQRIRTASDSAAQAQASGR